MRGCSLSLPSRRTQDLVGGFEAGLILSFGTRIALYLCLLG